MKTKHMKIISTLYTLDYLDLLSFIDANIDDNYFEYIMAKKYLQSIYYETKFSDYEKISIINKLIEKMPNNSDALMKTYNFIKLFFPIANGIYTEIQDTIKKYFSGADEGT